MTPAKPNQTRRRLLLGTLAALGMDAVQAATWQKLNTATGDAGKWNKLNVDAGTGWRKLGGAGGRVVVNLTIAANTQNYNIFNNRGGTYVAGQTDVILTVNAGVVVGSSSTGSYSLDTGTGWAAGDTISIVNNGYIAGMGGKGANSPVAPGGAGGPSLALRWPVSIANGAGYIYSGGGGGASGGMCGGGGGAGNAVGAGGVYAPNPSLVSLAGAAGGLTHGGCASHCNIPGGALGVTGGNGFYAASWSIWAPGGGGGGGASGGDSQYQGGGHGLAITLNGNAITWVSGNTRVYGGVA